ncbi:MAG: 30S ribosomal protein S17 [Candidatus Coatesbacteria bacterium 4484_99]|uniref:Small ribosomal subunit protein uS17 n=1 Tax=Candidatus Coatesbacteria bacterium 4484_99 TaxID=1970774 RepID=A0A1W9S0N3_9BACT|nr:MAG: 30S ribosomal protein S17 [Candidatus Coatesbacteria bacterium 4484_99]RLC41410.1 MAG: 30S ribosomal protein S17 [Candidatus Coatesbacteria bacterium]RLC44714.1 MAG: 30S ribosomal protein S17 [Candidatus Coatesbacteria bacterium]
MVIERGKRKVREGVVIRTSMDKTAVVEVTRVFMHPLYKRSVKKTKKYYIHDEKNECTVGDRVRIMETRPLSKTKRWRLVEILERAK